MTKHIRKLAVLMLLVAFAAFAAEQPMTGSGVKLPPYKTITLKDV